MRIISAVSWNFSGWSIKPGANSAATSGAATMAREVTSSRLPPSTPATRSISALTATILPSCL